MKYHIFPNSMNRKEKTYAFLRWFFYCLILLFLYSIMCSGTFKVCQPVLIVPLAIAVSMWETEFSGAIFGTICGLLLDIAGGGLFGFSAIWLLPCCLIAALLVANFIKPNLINHLWLTASTLLVLDGMNYLFNFAIWERRNSPTIFTDIYIPSMIITLVLSPILYFTIKAISKKLTHTENSITGRLTETTDPDEKRAKEE